MLRRLLRVSRGGLLAAATVAALLLVPAAANANEVRIGSAPVVPEGTTLVASVASVSSLQLTIALQPRDSAALAAYAEGVSSPRSAQYRHFLTTSQFRARFAPTGATISAVKAALRARGLTPGHVDASGLALTVTASAGQIERAFKVRLSRVRLRDGKDAFFNEQAPAVNSRIAGDIQAIIGLDTLYPEQSSLLHGTYNKQRAAKAKADRAHDVPQVATGGPQPCSQAVNDAPGYGGYTADQIASYYNFSSLYGAGDKGQGVTVALFELEPDSPSDIAAYQQCYGTHTQVSYVKVDGGAGKGAGSGEAALDIEQIIGLAPKVNLLVYQGPNTNNGSGPYDTYAEIANQDKASVVSTSWGSCESEETQPAAEAEATVFEQMAVQGQTMVAAAGDSGSEDCFLAGANSNNSLEVDDPASQPFVTGAGGTSLELGTFNLGGNSNPDYPTANPNETVWNNSYPYLQYLQTWGITPGAGGGGVSAFWSMPAYQSDTITTSPWLNVKNGESSGALCGAAAGGYCREVPDVSANADPMDGYMSYWNGSGQAGHDALTGWQAVGGTSAVAPLWASLFALAEASSSCSGDLIGFANPSLYALASSSPTAYASDFNDITADAIAQAGDDNDLVTSGNAAALYQAGPGYDMATGLGTPNAGNLAPALCTEALHVQVTAPAARESFVGAKVKLRVNATVTGGQAGTVTYRAKNLPKGLHLNPVTGVVTGKVKQSGVYLTVFGAYTSGGDFGGRAYVWNIAKRPEASALSLKDAAGGHPSLAFTLSAGEHESALRRVIVELPAGVYLVRPARDISVIGAAGHAVAHRISISGSSLVINFQPAHSPDTIVFNAGALRSIGALAAGSVAPVKLVLRMVDAQGYSTTVTRLVTPIH